MNDSRFGIPKLVLLVAVLFVCSCNFEAQPSNKILGVSSDVQAELVFRRDGTFEYNDQNFRLGDPVSRWIEIFGKPSRVRRNQLYIWDHVGLKIFTDRSSKYGETPEPSDLAEAFELHFVHWATYDPILGDPDAPGGLPLGFFSGVFEYGGVQIDRDTSIQEFVAINNLNDSPSRPHDYRHLIEDSDPKLYFSISPKGTEDGPYKPKSLDISIWE